MERRRSPDGRLNIRLDEGDEALSALHGICAEEGIRNAVFWGIGACRKAEISHYDTVKKRYHRKELEGMIEIISLTGNVTFSEGAPRIHAHIALGLPDFSMQGGHADSIHVDPTCEIVLIPLEGEVRREPDDKTGLMLQRL